MIVDTMVYVFALLNVRDFASESIDVLDNKSRLFAPDSIRAELASAMTKWMKAGHASMRETMEAIDAFRALQVDVVSTDLLWERALKLSILRQRSVYDTLFVALAEMKNTPVVTYDKKMRDVFPEWTVSPTQFLETRGGSTAFGDAPVPQNR